MHSHIKETILQAAGMEHGNPKVPAVGGRKYKGASAATLALYHLQPPTCGPKPKESEKATSSFSFSDSVARE